MKVFISQPMRGRDMKDILAERDIIKKMVACMYGDDTEFIDSIFTEDYEKGAKPLWLMGKALQALSEADVAVFFGDPALYRGCSMEYQACFDYGIKAVYLWRECEW